jgi:protein O-mannosyl-transferase
MVLVICALLALVTLAVYWPVFQCEFVNYDDPYYVTGNPQVRAGLTWAGLCWAFTTRYCFNWYPLTWISHMLDCDWYGLEPAGHHATSLLLHIANTVLVFLMVRRMTGAQWRSAFVAALFALHPMHVESVAWVAERKDVLSTFFVLLTIRAYLRYAEKPERGRYLAVAGLFALGLMAKPMLVTLPCLLLLLDFWPLRRMPATVRAFGRDVILAEPSLATQNRSTPLGRLVLEKLPLLALSVVSSAITLSARAEPVGAGGSVGSIAGRLGSAVVAYGRYLAKMLWPANLVVYYPQPRAWPAGYLVLAAAVVAGLSILAVWQLRKRPYLFTGWFWFIGTLVPVIGLVQFWMQSLADRYTYIPSIGLFLALAWGGYDLAKQWSIPTSLTGVAAALVVAMCIPLTHTQLGYWRNSTALFEHALQLTSNNFVAEYNLGVTFFERGQLDPAVQHFARACGIMPEYAEAQRSLGQTLLLQGKFEEAIGPSRAALRRDPDSAAAHYVLGTALGRRGDLAEARPHLEAALHLAPTFWEAHDELGVVLMKQGDVPGAQAHFTEALRLSPMNAEVCNHLAALLKQSGRTKEAVTLYRQVLDLNPQMPEALNALAWILATYPDRDVRNGEEAVSLAERACQLTAYQEPRFVGTLGAAYAEAGRFEEAVTAAEKAEASATAAGNRDVAEESRKMAEIFRARQPVRESAAAAAAPAQENP